MDGIVGKVSAFGPSGWQCGKSSSEVQCWNRIEAVSQMKTPCDFRGAIDIIRGIGYNICTEKIKLVWEADDSLSWQ